MPRYPQKISFKRKNSDNSTTFFGARGELESRRILRDEEFKDLINTFASQNHIDWFKIATRTPHCEGLCEAPFKSMKCHLYRTVGSTELSTSAFTTLLTQFETILNSRPLTAPSTDINDLSDLTHGHFIICITNTSLFELSLPRNNTLSRYWRNIDKTIRQIWKKLLFIAAADKMEDRKRTISSISSGRNCDNKEDSTPPICWPLARIIQTFDGNDNIVRNVQVKTQT